MEKFGDVVAAQDFNLAIEDKESCFSWDLLLRQNNRLALFSRLEEITEGEVYIGDVLANDIAPQRPRHRDGIPKLRALPLHDSVRQYGLGLKLRKTPKNILTERVQVRQQEPLVSKISYTANPKNSRSAPTCSGWSCTYANQRSSLDEPSRTWRQTARTNPRRTCGKLHKRLETTFIYVTHDQTEAMTMATRIAVMNKGVLQQLDTPQVLYDHPANHFVAGFIGSPSMNFFDGVIEQREDGIYVNLGSFAVRVPEKDYEALNHLIGRPIIFGIRPEDIHNPVYAPPGIIAEPVAAEVDVTELMGNEIFLYLVNGDHNFIARVDPRTRMDIGDKVEVVFNMDNYHIFDPGLDEENPVAVF